MSIHHLLNLCYYTNMLKKNSKVVLDIIAGQKQRNASKAYKEVHPNSSDNTAKINASHLLAKPEAQLYLQEHKREAQETVVEVMQNARQKKDSANFQRLAKDTADSIIDRLDGKATQMIEQHTTGVTLTIDLTSALAAPNKE